MPSQEAYEAAATVTAGKLTLSDPGSFKAALRRFADGPVIVQVAVPRESRTLESNRDYWGYYVRPLADHTGYTKDEMHAYLKQRFLPADKRRSKTLTLCDQHGVVIDETVVDLSTTTTLTEQEMADYKYAIAVFAAELGVMTGKKDWQEQRALRRTETAA